MFSLLQLFFLLPSVLSEQMDWGDNPYLVDESVTIQGREHIKLAVVMVGGSIDLECQVAFTSEPVSKIRWKIDGKLTDDAKNQTEEIKNGEIFVEDHLRIVNITADMDGSTVSCEYSKGQYGASVETVFRVFSPELDIPEKVCNAHAGNVQLTFKESKRTSPAEETVDEKIKIMIVKMINVTEKEITVDELGYSVNLSIKAVYDNKVISNMKPDTKIDGAHVEDGITKCNTSKTTTSTTDTNKYSKEIENYTENTDNEQGPQLDKKASPKIGVLGYVMIACAVIGLLLLLLTVMIEKQKGDNNILSILKKRVTGVEEQSLFWHYCSYCNFKTDTEFDLESHNAEYKRTHSTVDYNDDHQEVQLEVLKLTESGLRLEKVNKEKLSSSPIIT